MNEPEAPDGPLPEVIVSRPDQLAECLAHLATCPVFGFDTEFVGEDSYHPRLCLVQVATPERLYVIDPFTVGPLDGFWQLVIDPSHLVVVHAGREEVRLCRLWGGQAPQNLFDLQLAAGLLGPVYPLGHAALVGQYLGVHIPKGETLTEWRDRPLTRQQMRYAFDDVRFLLPLWKMIHGRLEERGRVEWAQEEFRRLCQQAAPEEPVAEEKWRKLRGAGSLDRRRLAILRGLYHWREELAARTNRPPRSLVRDDLLVEIARRNPGRERDLQVVRGLPRRDLDQILEVVQQARALPNEECPRATEREFDSPQLLMVSGVLQAALAEMCLRMELAPGLVASNSEVRLLVRCRQQAKPLPDDSILAQGWRRPVILEPLQELLEGRRWLRIADPAGELPFGFREHGS